MCPQAVFEGAPGPAVRGEYRDALIPQTGERGRCPPHRPQFENSTKRIGSASIECGGTRDGCANTLTRTHRASIENRNESWPRGAALNRTRRAAIADADNSCRYGRALTRSTRATSPHARRTVASDADPIRSDAPRARTHSELRESMTKAHSSSSAEDARSRAPTSRDAHSAWPDCRIWRRSVGSSPLWGHGTRHRAGARRCV